MPVKASTRFVIQTFSDKFRRLALVKDVDRKPQPEGLKEIKWPGVDAGDPRKSVKSGTLKGCQKIRAKTKRGESDSKSTETTQ